jgi:hypothetical protein
LTGPSVKRLPPSEPALHDPALNVIQSIFGSSNPGNVGSRGTPTRGTGNVLENFGSRFGFQQPGGLPPELISAFANYLAQPSADQRTNAATLSMQGGLGGASNIPGFDVLNAAGPVFSRNLTESLARQNNQGPRFSSTNDAQGRLLQQQGLQDFNLFAQQVLEGGRARQLQGILGYAQANQGQQGLQLQGQQLQLQALMPIIQALFGQGLSPGVTVGPSPLGQIAGVAGAGLGAAAGLGWQPFKP